jgi:acyl-CoA thioesterase FadM
MNVAAYVKKFDEGTWLLWDAVGLSAHRMAETRHGLAALKSEVAYAREVFLGESLTVRSAIVDVGNKTARFRHVMSVAKPEGPVEAARCDYLVCFLDREGHKGAPWPEDLRASLTRWMEQAHDEAEGAS